MSALTFSNPSEYFNPLVAIRSNRNALFLLAESKSRRITGFVCPLCRVQAQIYVIYPGAVTVNK